MRKTVRGLGVGCAMAATSMLLVAGEGSTDAKASRGAGPKRFSFGILAGASLTTPGQDRSISYISCCGVSESAFRPGLPPPSAPRPAVRVSGRDSAFAPLVGILAEVSVTRRVSVQAGASFRWRRGTRLLDINYDEPYKRFSSFSTEPIDTAFLEFPVTARYTFGNSAWRPVLGVGPAFRTPQYSGGPIHGVVATFGVRTPRRGWWTVSPGLRYTRWSTRGFPSDTPRNQVQAMIVFAF